MKVSLAVAAAVVLLPITAGCGSVARGTLVGTVRIYGGPDTAHGMALNGKPTSGAKVVARSGSTVVTTTSGATGRFTFHLPPGRYTLACNRPLYSERSTPIQVRSNARTSADCRIDVP